MIHPPLRLVPPPHRTERLRPEQRRRTPAAGRRPAVAVLGPQGPAALDRDDVRRLAQVADVTFHRSVEASDPATVPRLPGSTEVLVVLGPHRPVLDDRLIASVPSLRGVILAGTGVTGIEVRRLEARRVGVVVVPEHATRAVAAHALALLRGLRSARPTLARRPLLAG